VRGEEDVRGGRLSREERPFAVRTFLRAKSAVIATAFSRPTTPLPLLNPTPPPGVVFRKCSFCGACLPRFVSAHSIVFSRMAQQDLCRGLSPPIFAGGHCGPPEGGRYN